jgi:hypothetical protein
MGKAPWTEKEVTALNAFQSCGRIHPFTCGGDHGSQTDRVLVATPSGWVCRGCDYTQDWAHDFMFQDVPPAPEWLRKILAR